MKKLLLVLLASAAVTPAMAQNWGYAAQQGGDTTTVYQRTTTTYQQPVVTTTTTTTNRQVQPATQNVQYTTRTVPADAPAKYKLGNPIGRPHAGGVFLGAEATYFYVPKDDAENQDKVTGWTVIPNIEIGLTDKLSIKGSVGYGQAKIKSGIDKGVKLSTYTADAQLSYLLASLEGLDFNVHAGAYYNKERWKYGSSHGTVYRTSGADVGLLVGKKIQNVTPYFGVGFQSDFYSSKDNETGTQTYINPGIYVDINKTLGLDLSYESYTHGTATYQARLDIYPANNVVIGVGGYIMHPEEKTSLYGAKVNFKVAF